MYDCGNYAFSSDWKSKRNSSGKISSLRCFFFLSDLGGFHPPDTELIADVRASKQLKVIK